MYTVVYYGTTISLTTVIATISATVTATVAAIMSLCIAGVDNMCRTSAIDNSKQRKLRNLHRVSKKPDCSNVF